MARTDPPRLAANRTADNNAGIWSARGGSRSTPPPPSSSDVVAGDVGPTVPRTRPRRERQPGHGAVGRRRDEERPDPPGGPAHRRPRREFDQLGRRPRAGDLDDRLAAAQRSTSTRGRLVGEFDHPPADATTVEVDTNDRADLDGRAEFIGNEVVERPVEPRHVGEDSGDQRRRRVAQAPTATMKSSRRPSSSHGKPGRPKWP